MFSHILSCLPSPPICAWQSGGGGVVAFACPHITCSMSHHTVRRASRTGVRGCREEGGHVCEGAKRLGGRTGPVGCMGRVGRGQDAWGGRQDTSGRQNVSVGVQDMPVGWLEALVGGQDKWAAQQHIWWLARCIQWERRVSGGPGCVVGGLDV